jgi:hypothetical protein
MRRARQLLKCRILVERSGSACPGFVPRGLCACIPHCDLPSRRVDCESRNRRRKFGMTSCPAGADGNGVWCGDSLYGTPQVGARFGNGTGVRLQPCQSRAFRQRRRVCLPPGSTRCGARVTPNGSGTTEVVVAGRCDASFMRTRRHGLGDRLKAPKAARDQPVMSCAGADQLWRLCLRHFPRWGVCALKVLAECIAFASMSSSSRLGLRSDARRHGRRTPCLR